MIFEIYHWISKVYFSHWSPIFGYWQSSARERKRERGKESDGPEINKSLISIMFWPLFKKKNKLHFLVILVQQHHRHSTTTTTIILKKNRTEWAHTIKLPDLDK